MSGYNQFGMGGGMGPPGAGGIGPNNPGMMGGNYNMMGGPGWGGMGNFGPMGGPGPMNPGMGMMNQGQGPATNQGWNDGRGGNSSGNYENSGTGSLGNSGNYGNNSGNYGNSGNTGNNSSGNYGNSGNIGNPSSGTYGNSGNTGNTSSGLFGNSGNAVNTSSGSYGNSGNNLNTSGGNYGNRGNTGNSLSSNFGGQGGNSSGFQAGNDNSNFGTQGNFNTPGNNTIGGGDFRYGNDRSNYNSGTQGARGEGTRGDDWRQNKNNMNSGNYGTSRKSLDSAPSMDLLSSSTSNSAMSLGLNLSKQEPSYWDKAGNSNWQAGRPGNLSWSSSQGESASASKDIDSRSKQTDLIEGKWQGPSREPRGNVTNMGGARGNWSGSGDAMRDKNSNSGGNWSSSGGNFNKNPAINMGDPSGKSTASSAGYWSSTGATEDKGEALMEISDEDEEKQDVGDATSSQPTDSQDFKVKVKAKKNGSTPTISNGKNKKSDKAKEQEVYHCQICNVTVKGLMPYLIHVQGQRHLRAEADKREKEQAKSKPPAKKPAVKQAPSPVQDSRSLGIAVMPKPSILRNKRSTDYPVDPPENKMGRYEDRPSGPSRSSGRYSGYDTPDPTPPYGRTSESSQSYGRGVIQEKKDGPVVIDYGHSKARESSNPVYDSSMSEALDYGRPSSSFNQPPSNLSGPNLDLQKALDTVLSMVQGSGAGGINPLASTIQAAIDTKVQAAVSAQLQGSMMASQPMNTSAASNLLPPSSLLSAQSQSTTLKSLERRSQEATPRTSQSSVVASKDEGKPRESSKAVVRTETGLVKTGDGQYFTMERYMRKQKYEAYQKKSTAARTGEPVVKESPDEDENSVGKAVWTELKRIRSTSRKKDVTNQALISNIVSKVVKEFMNINPADETSQQEERSEPTQEQKGSQIDREMAATALMNPTSKEPPAFLAAKNAPNLTSKGSKEKGPPVVYTKGTRRKRTPPPPVRFSVNPVKKQPASVRKTDSPLAVLGDSSDEEKKSSDKASTELATKAVTSAASGKAPVVTTSNKGAPGPKLGTGISTSNITPTAPIAKVKDQTGPPTSQGNTIPSLNTRTSMMTFRTAGTPQASKTTGPETEGKTPGNKPAKNEKSGEKEKTKKKLSKEEKKKRKAASGKAAEWSGIFDDDFAKKREELEKILSDNITKSEKKRTDSRSRLSQVKKRGDDFDSSPYEDISDMSDISSDESDFSDHGRRADIARRSSHSYRRPPRSPLSRRLSLGGRRSESPPTPPGCGAPLPRLPRLRGRTLSRSRSPPSSGGLRPIAHKRINDPPTPPGCGGLLPRRRSITPPPRRRYPSPSRSRRRSISPRGRRRSSRSSPFRDLRDKINEKRTRDSSPLSPPRDRLGSISPTDVRLGGLKPRYKRRSRSPLSPPRDRLGSLTPSEELAASRLRRSGRSLSPRGSLRSISPGRSIVSSHSRARSPNRGRRHSSEKKSGPAHGSQPPEKRSVSPVRSRAGGSLSPVSDDDRVVEVIPAPQENKRGEEWYEQEEPLSQIPPEKITTAYGALLNVLAPGCVRNEQDLVLATEMIAELTQALVVLMEGQVDQEYRDRFIKAADGFGVNHGDHPLVAAFHDASNVAPAIIITLSQQEPVFLQKMMEILLTRSDILERVLHSNDELIEFIKLVNEGKDP